MAILDDALRRQLAAPAVYSHLINNCFSLNESTAQAIEKDKDWQLSATEIDRLGIRSCPSFTGNLLACFSLQNTFSRDTLLQTPGLYPFDYKSRPCVCLEFRNDCICDREFWRIDLDPKLAERGFIVPVRHPQYLYFEALRIYRDTRDQHGFLLRLRDDERRVA